MLYDLSNPLHAANFKLRCNALYTEHAMVELTRKTTRTLRQNAYLHSILAYFAAMNHYTIDEVKRWYFKELCSPDLFIIETTDPFTGRPRQRLRSSRDLTTEQMTTAIERFRNWSAQKAGLYIPSPDEHRLVQQMELEIDRAKNYIYG
jgi:response regulator RpfG family c-di-GMP phosphodiesterase